MGWIYTGDGKGGIKTLAITDTIQKPQVTKKLPPIPEKSKKNEGKRTR
jgi:hypothetical protein